MSKIQSFDDFIEEIKYWLIKPLLQATNVDNHIYILLILFFSVCLFSVALIGFALFLPYIFYVNLRKNYDYTIKTNKLLLSLGFIICGIVYYKVLEFLGIIVFEVNKNLYENYPYRINY